MVCQRPGEAHISQSSRLEATQKVLRSMHPTFLSITFSDKANAYGCEYAFDFISSWGSGRILNASISLNALGKKCLVEPRIEGEYRKFNSNTGWVQDSDCITEALSHYSYHVSNGRYLLCDLQGGVSSDMFMLTDPVVHSLTDEFGVTDGGKDAMDSFFSRHKCNRFCQSGWARAVHLGGHAPHAARSEI